MPQAVSDALSNTNEHIEQAAKAIGKSADRRAVFEAIYHGKKRAKTAEEISDKTGIEQKRVTMAGKLFVDRGIVDGLKENGKTAYKKIDFYHTHKSAILSLAGNKKKLEQLPTKQRPRPSTSVTITLDTSKVDTKQITIDDIGSFRAVKKIKTDGFLPSTVLERDFKAGVQAVIGESGKFQDWGGEKNDLLTTRVIVNGKRIATAFAFKGPGKKGPLVPGKMGKNGDQIQRLFESTAELFIIQYGEEIRESVIDQMQQLAVAKSSMTGKRVLYCVIDGADSNRLYQAYPKEFGQKAKRKKQAKKR